MPELSVSDLGIVEQRRRELWVEGAAHRLVTEAGRVSDLAGDPLGTASVGIGLGLCRSLRRNLDRGYQLGKAPDMLVALCALTVPVGLILAAPVMRKDPRGCRTQVD